MEAIDKKIRPLNEVSPYLEDLKAQGKKIVMCHGVFDLLHLGHIRYLNSAKRHGDVLVVTTTSDQHVKRGPGRPVFNQHLRAEALANLAMTDVVVIVDYPTAVEAIEQIRPHFYVKGPDYKNRAPDPSSRLKDEEAAIRAVGGEIIYTDDEVFSSSQLINNYFSTLPEPTAAFLKEIATRYSIEDIKDYFDKIKALKILVVGDAIIDQYHYTQPLGKSAKENIVVNKYLSEEDFAGGSLATANHIAQISGPIDLLTILGRDDSYESFVLERLNKSIAPYVYMRPNCRTTVKRRFVEKNENRKLFEICYLDDHPLSTQEEETLLKLLNRDIASYDLVIVNDFGHGMLTKHLRTIISSEARSLALNVQTNSANIGYNIVTNYPQADFVCIDEPEIRLATRDKFSEVPTLVQRLYNSLGPRQIIVTRGSKGSLSYTRTQGFVEAPAFTSFGVDRIGAGDAFFAYTAPCFAVGMPPDLVGLIGNAVGALKLQIVGNREPVKRGDLIKFLTRLLKV